MQDTLNLPAIEGIDQLVALPLTASAALLCAKLPPRLRVPAAAPKAPPAT